MNQSYGLPFGETVFFSYQKVSQAKIGSTYSKEGDLF